MFLNIICRFCFFSFKVLFNQRDWVKIIALLMLLLSFSRRCSVSVAADIHSSNNTIEGTVRDEQHPVSGAIVRVQATEMSTVTDDKGHFILTGLYPSKSVILTAWASGYYIGGGQEYLPGKQDVEILLVPHTTEDNTVYEWVSAFSVAGEENNCQNCHAEPNDPSSALPFDEWQLDAHSKSARNIHFITMYYGTDVGGNVSPKTRYGYNRDYGRFPLRPDVNEAYYGPGYKLDFPSTNGNCAACHIPAAAINDPYGVNPFEVDDIGAEGIGCDLCHKVWDVRLDPATGLPYENMPGVLSFEFRRPPEGHQFFAGPFDDVAPGEDTYTEIQQQSQYCAPCHFGSFWGTKIYNSYGEWLESQYSDPQTGKTCQDCHMPRGLTKHFVRFDKGGKLRDPASIFSHRMPGATDVELLQNAVTMNVTAGLESNKVFVDVSITNDQTGHHVPTDSPLRQMIMLVDARDSQGQALSLIEGPVIPNWGGIGDPNDGYYAGLPGKGFAKILEELWTAITPSGAYWNHTLIASDNRIAAFAIDKSSYIFPAPTEGNITVNVILLFRRAFINLMDQKSWDIPDIVMEQQTLIVTNKE